MKTSLKSVFCGLLIFWIRCRFVNAETDLAELIREDEYIAEEREEEGQLEMEESFVDLEGNREFKPAVKNYVNPLEDMADQGKISASSAHYNEYDHEILRKNDYNQLNSSRGRDIALNNNILPDEMTSSDDWVVEHLAEGTGVANMEYDVNEQNTTGLPEKRKVLFPHRLWPNGVIPWSFNSGQKRLRDPRSKLLVRRVMEKLMSITCIRFQHFTPRRGRETVPYLDIQSGRGCSATVGYVRNSDNHRMSLNERGCIHYGIVMHEFGHVVGLIHEHMRTDRARYINVQRQNAEARYAPNFAVWTNTRNLVKYDLASNMHYSAEAFSSNGEDTIIVKDPRLQFLVGRRGEMSFYDTKAINEAYNCHRNCGSSRTCINDGFLASDCRCRCPDGLAGDRCDQIDVTETSGCGGVINITPTTTVPVVIQSPSYPTGVLGSRCIWLITTAEGYRIGLNLTNVYLTRYTGHECQDWVEVKYNLLGQTGPRFCGRTAVAREMIATDNTTLIIFDGETGGGFRLEARIDEASIADTQSFLCNFENNEWGNCPFQQNTNDDFNWRIGRRRTPSGGTGPRRAANGTTYYLYIEASRPRILNDIATLDTNYIPGSSGCLSFFYNMYGPQMGRFWVTVTCNTSETVTAFSREGNQGREWKHQEIFIASRSDFKITIGAGVGSTHRSDLAVDEIAFVSTPCSTSDLVTATFGLVSVCADITCSNRGACIPTGFDTHRCSCDSIYTGNNCEVISSIVGGAVSCFFDRNSEQNIGHFCIFNSDPNGNLNWIFAEALQWDSRNIGGRRRSFVVAENVGELIEIAKLDSLEMNHGLWCLEFDSILPRRQGNSLRIEILDTHSQVLRRKELIATNFLRWKTFKLKLLQETNFKIRILVAIGNGSFAAIDSLGLQPGSCRNVNGMIDLTDSTSHRPPPRPFRCTFDRSACGFVNKARATLDWVLKKKDRRFGPMADHTGVRRYYLSPDMFFRERGSFALAESPVIRMDGQTCLTFYCYFFGHKLGSLSVYANNQNNNRTRPVFLWMKDATVTVSRRQRWEKQRVLTNLRGSFKIEFFFRLNYFYGSVGIDDISLIPGRCRS